MTPWAFLFVLIFFSRPTAAIFGASNETDFWENFANNFATDLAPIISLFGEQVTKQFLSESTTILDTIIFAVGPLGIITAIVSCIRVRGGLFLRSIVGRAREPHGTAEIELCSSTSHDVCELWSNGGVCRVFGRPKILEFIYLLPRDPREYYYSYNSSPIGSDKKIPATCGIELAREFFQNLHPKSAAGSEARNDATQSDDTAESPQEWKEVPSNRTIWAPLSIFIQWTFFHKDRKCIDSEEGVGHKRRFYVEKTSDSFAPFPNLALNIGVQSTKSTVITLWLAATFGILLQGSFFFYATWATWYHPGFYNGEKVSNTNVFFTLTMVGTTSIVAGMALCAWLIDGNSKERRFHLSYPDSSNQSSTAAYRLFWLQAGGQRIGDQEFEAFAHDELKSDYVTSWRVSSNRRISHTLVFFATGLSFLGWAAQFVGLRGQHATISLYQLCCTVIMSIIRAFIRSYRFTPENKLETIQATIQGHELDWQASCLVKSSPRKEDRDPEEDETSEIYWTLSSQKPKPFFVERLDGDNWQAFYTTKNILVMLHDSCRSSNKVANFIEANKLDCDMNGDGRQDGLDDVINGYDDNSVDRNDDNFDVPNEGALLMRLRWRLGFLTDQPFYPAWDSEFRKVALKLERCLGKSVEALNRGGSTEPHSLIWSATCEVRKDPRLREPQGMPISFQMTRSSKGWSADRNQLEAILGLWSWTLERSSQQPGNSLNDDPRKPRYKRVAVESQRANSTAVLLDGWGVQTLDMSPPVPCPNISNLSVPIIISQYLRGSPRSGAGEEASRTFSIGATSPMLHLMAQDIFTIFVERISLLLQDDLADILLHKNRLWEERQQVSIVDSLVEALISEGLATRSEALMSIIPGLSDSPQLSDDVYIQRNLISQANELKRKQKFSESEQLLKHSLTVFSNLELRGFKCLYDIYRSELRWMLHHRTTFSRKECRTRCFEMHFSSPSPQGDTTKEFKNIFKAVFQWLVSNASQANDTPTQGLQLGQRGLPLLDLESLEELGLEDLNFSDALTMGLTLSERFSLLDCDIGIRKQLLRWAIERDCTGLLEDLWASESSGNPGESSFSRGFDEIFWAINLHTAPNDMMNTILFLLITVEVPVSAPLRLHGELDEEWWITSRNKDMIKSSYEKYDRVLVAASANPNGLEMVQLLVNGVIAKDLKIDEYEQAARMAASSDNLEIMEFLLSLVVCRLDSNKLRDEQDTYSWEERLLFASTWGHGPYLEHLLDRQLKEEHFLPLIEAQRAAQNRLSEDRENRVSQVPGLDRRKVAGIIERRLKCLQEIVEESRRRRGRVLRNFISSLSEEANLGEDRVERTDT